MGHIKKTLKWNTICSLGKFGVVVLFSLMIALATAYGFGRAQYGNSLVYNIVLYVYSFLQGEPMPQFSGAFYWQEIVIGMVTLSGSIVIGYSLLHENVRWLSFCCRWRWIIALVILVISVSLELNSTSIDAFSVFTFSDNPDVKHAIFGAAQNSRGDEFAVWTPMALSQAFSGYKSINPLISGGGVSSLWVSMGGLPAWNSATIFKPFYWGFLLLGFSKGLSLLYVLRWLLLFLISFELALRYTNGNRRYSFIVGIIFTFAQYVQWLFSQSIAEVLIFSQGMLIFLWEYLNTVNVRKRWLCATGIAYCFGCFIMIAYPAWLLPMFYTTIAFSIALIVMQRNQVSFRNDFVRFLLPMIVVLILLVIILLEGKDALRQVAGSVYPGQRLETGGELPVNQYSGILALALPFVTSLNPYILANFLTFTPLGLVLSADALIVKKKKDPILFALLSCYLFFMLFQIVGFPAWLAKLTIMSQCTPSRLVMATGPIEVVLIFRALTLIRQEAILSSKANWKIVICSLGLGIIALLSASKCAPGMWIISWCCGLLTVLIVYFLLKSIFTGELFLTFMLFSVLIVSGGAVNPVQPGISPLVDTEGVKAVRAVKSNPDDLWASTVTYPYIMVPLMAGKRTLNTVQEYADVEKWKPIDPEGIYQDVYNRFAMVDMELTDEKTSFELINVAEFMLHLNVRDMEKMGIDYIMSLEVYPEEWDGVQFELCGFGGGYKCYRIIYSDDN